MKNPEILHPLKTYCSAIEDKMLTTIHLINDRILTEIDTNEEDVDYENAFGEFYCAGI